MAPPDITSLSVSSLARAVARGELSATEIVAAHVARINELNPSINAIVQLPIKRGLEEARVLDADSSTPSHAPLRGLPFTVKDNFETQGTVTAIGMTERKGVVSSHDAILVRHVRSLGSILLGKTNCPPGGAGGGRSRPRSEPRARGGLFTDNDVYAERTPPTTCLARRGEVAAARPLP